MPLAPFAPRPRPGEDPLRRGRLAILLAILGIVAALLAYAISPGVRHAVRRAAHAVTHVFRDSDRRAAPPLPAAVLVGPRVTLAGLHGHPALVTFWDASCPACAREAHAVERFAATPAGRGRVVGVDLADSAARGRAFVHHHRWSFPNLLDAGGAVGRRYGVSRPSALPRTYVLDASGRIAATLSGSLTGARMSGGLRKGGA